MPEAADEICNEILRGYICDRETGHPDLHRAREQIRREGFTSVIDEFYWGDCPTTTIQHPEWAVGRPV